MCIVKHSSVLKSLAGLAAGMALTVLSAGGADWQNVVLAGTFTSAQADATDPVLVSEEGGHMLFRNYTRGSGLTSYSLSLGKAVEDNAGELVLLTGFTSPSATTANFSLTGESVVDLGPLAAPPAKLKLPKSGWFSHPYTGFRKMVAGNYYYIAGSGQHLIVQPMAFDVSNVRVTDEDPGMFGYTIHSADCALKIRFLSASTLEGLQQQIKASPWTETQSNAAGKAPVPKIQ